MKHISKSKIISLSVAIIIGILLGWVLFGRSSSNNEAKHDEHVHDQEVKENDITWTCAMHPQIRQNKPGKCPICAMDLTPLKQSSGIADNQFTVQMSEEAVKLANVQTSRVSKGEAKSQELMLTGKIEVDERRIYEIPAHFHGRMEELYVNFTGQHVAKGEALASVYSPELITAQQELLEVLAYKESNPSMYNAARNKLKNWKISQVEIDSIEKTGEVINELTIRSHQQGYVMTKNVAVGDHVKMGDILFEVADLSRLWVMLDAYEQHLPWIEVGDKVKFTTASESGKKYEAEVTFIDPFIDPETRVAKVRAEIANKKSRLKPEMFVRATVTGEAVIENDKLTIPQSAVLWTGKRSLVYVKKEGFKQPVFEYREIVLGPITGDYFIVEEGLSEGEEIVTNGAFTIDAAAQLSGKASMMNPQGDKMPTGHEHMNMDMDTDNDQTGTNLEGKIIDQENITEEFKRQLAGVVDEYLEMKNALVESNPNKVKETAEEVKISLDKVNMELLKKDAHMFWMEALEPMKKELEHIIAATDIQNQRVAFSILSACLVQAIEVLGVEADGLYLQFCPMANDNQGAYWLSESKEIENPFMPETMLRCGEIKKEIPANK